MNTHLSYPVNQFRVLRRALTDWKLLLKAIYSSTEPDKEDKLRKVSFLTVRKLRYRDRKSGINSFNVQPSKLKPL